MHTDLCHISYDEARRANPQDEASEAPLLPGLASTSVLDKTFRELLREIVDASRLSARTRAAAAGVLDGTMSLTDFGASGLLSTEMDDEEVATDDPRERG